MERIIHLKPNAQEIETWIATIDNVVVGHIYMKVEKDNKVKFLDAWVDPEWRRKGIYRKLWETRWQYVNDNYKDWTVYAWSKNESLPLLIEKGFEIGDTATYVEKKI